MNHLTKKFEVDIATTDQIGQGQVKSLSKTGKRKRNRERENAYFRKKYKEDKNFREEYKRKRRERGRRGYPELKADTARWGKHLASKRNYYRGVRQEFIKKMGGKCVKCGFTDWRALQIDHIKGGGRKDKYRAMQLTKDKREYVINRPEDFQLLCSNCNWIKKYENHET